MEDLEDTDFVASEHDRLVSAITKLDKTQHITEPTRDEPTKLNSEFNLIKRSAWIDLNKVAKVLEDTANHVKIGKKLKKTQDGSNVLPKPLEKPVVERIKRATGYEETSKRVGRWDPVVARARSDDFQSFPLNTFRTKLQPTGEFLSKFKLKSQLEKELEEIDPPLQEKVEDDEEPVYPMSYDEMVEHRQHLAKIRAQESYKAAKAKRQSKIKSKKYHRILKKEKLKQQLKEFEELQIKDPEEALKKLDSLEKARALERHTLRHKNTGKWAKSKLVRAKYDKDTRQQLAEQLAVSRGLTHKTQDMDSTDDDADEPDIDVNLSHDPFNPWMMKHGDKSNVDAEFNFGYKKYVEGRMFKRKDDSSDDSGEENNIKTDNKDIEALKHSIRKIVDKDVSSDDDKNIDETESDTKIVKSLQKKAKMASLDQSKTVKTNNNISKSNTKATKKTKMATATSKWIVEIIDNPSSNEVENSEDILNAFESLEDDIAGQVERKLKAIRQKVEQLEKRKGKQTSNKHKKSEDFDNLEYLKIKNQKVKPIIDEGLIETSSKSPDKMQEKTLDKVLSTLNANAQEVSVSAKESGDSNIDPSRFIEVKPKYLNSALPNIENEFDEIDDDEQVVPKVNIEEVFEDDDVVAGFMQEKEDEINKDKPEDIDLSLPGWGSWGGKGVKAPKRKRNRFILKAPPKMPRRDENKGGVIIKEYRDPKLAAHKVSELPFPFKSVNEYEASIRAPLGNTFVPEKAHKKLIKPSVITKAGCIIEPMDEEELLVPKNRKFKNESVIKLLGQK